MGQASSGHKASAHEDLVDGGALVPQGVYTGAQDYDQAIVQGYIHSRKLAPFYKSFEDEDPDAATIAAAYPHLAHALQSYLDASSTSASASHSRSASTSSGIHASPAASAASSPVAALASASSSSSSPTSTSPRSGAVSQQASGVASPSHTAAARVPTDVLPHPLTECPICFLYYPSPLNLTRCCEQQICTECFVQIKRADPNHTNPPSSEPATCPYCMETNFGVVYRPPPSLLARSGVSSSGGGPGLVNNSTSPGGYGASHAHGAGTSRRVAGADDVVAASARRRKSFGHTDPEVITIDMIRPDWEDKLRQAQAAIARRANRRIIMRQVGDRLIPIGVSSSRAGAELPEGLVQGPGGAIIITGGEGGRWSIGTAGPGNMAATAAGSTATTGRGGAGSGAGDSSDASPLQTGRSDRGSSRSSRRRNQELAYLQALGGQDMEEIMLMEAMRLSLLEHEEQQRRQAAAAQREQDGSSAAPDNPQSAPTSADATSQQRSEVDPEPPGSANTLESTATGGNQPSETAAGREATTTGSSLASS